jgi:hypothetical protein
MESVYHIVTIRVNETSWAHVWRLRSHYLRTGYDMLATVLPSYAGDDAAGVTWSQRDVEVESCWQRCYRVMLAMTLPGRLGCDAM